ncbi:YfbK domain-containing protein [Lysobacter arenosi]|uniref:YfbK domain-containing protein n=1 Tax=Lysobacter arenosi TaxID=2795387 RepID=UPI001FD67C8D|nr:YfbK domain-containing protein [Lysobacter arenosi]
MARRRKPRRRTLGGEIAHLRLRYKLPGQDRSRLIETPVLASQVTRSPSESLRLASAVAGFADALRGGSRMDGWSLDAMIQSATAAKGRDPNGERAELVALMKLAQAQIDPNQETRIGLGR